MIKATMRNPDTNRTTLILVLERGNINHLEKSKPIHIHAEEMGIPSFSSINELIIILFETQEEALKFLKAGITKSTKIHNLVDKKKD